ncbi:hypothetical protein NQ317_011725 [Molorchus minor]|uniref:Phosphomevalonate kinase n=1 Tax=Molorchus minor TaxID=1323400 RepID=A0ABQ9JAG8_9CUCU|nr:hypothetical protein NQ317_011725 [Molorchus minor]
MEPRIILLFSGKRKSGKDYICEKVKTLLGLKTPGIFCKAACDNAHIKAVWLVSDIRRKTDIAWFKDAYGSKIKTIRITANLDVRKNRGWLFTKGVDDVASECDLDEFLNWDIQVSNNNTEESEEAIEKIINTVKDSLKED